MIWIQKCSSCEMLNTKITWLNCYDLLQSHNGETLFSMLVKGSCSPERPCVLRLVSHSGNISYRNLWKRVGKSNLSGCYVNLSIVKPFQTNTSTQSFKWTCPFNITTYPQRPSFQFDSLTILNTRYLQSSSSGTLSSVMPESPHHSTLDVIHLRARH